MAKIFYSGLVNTIRGNLGGSTLSQTRGIGTIRRANPHPRDARTEPQTRMRGIVNDLAGQWYALPSWHKSLWDSLAVMMPKPMTGLNAFVSYNQSLIYHLGPTFQRNWPPGTPFTPPAPIRVAARKLGTNDFRIFWTTPDDPDIYLIIQYRPIFSIERTQSHQWHEGTCVASNAAYADITTDYDSDRPCKFRIRSMDTYGRQSPWTHVLQGFPTTIDTSCVLYATLDDSRGTTASDTSGNANDGAITGATWIQGMVNSALYHDGIDDYTLIPNAPSLNITNNMTLIAWVYRRTGGDLHQGLISKGSASFPGARAWDWLIMNRTTLRFIDSNALQRGILNHPTDTWTFLAAVIDNNSLTLSIDVTTTDGPYPVTLNNIDRSITTGALRRITPGNSFLPGTLDEPRIYNTPLTPSQLQTIYDAEHHYHQ